MRDVSVVKKSKPSRATSTFVMDKNGVLMSDQDSAIDAGMRMTAESICWCRAMMSLAPCSF